MSKTQAIFFCLCSFVLGIAGASYYYNNLPKKRLDTFQMEFTPPKDANSVSNQEKKSSQVKSKKAELSVEEKIITQEDEVLPSKNKLNDYFSLTSQAKAFRKEIYREVDKKFKMVMPDPADQAFNQEMLKSDLAGRISNNMTWLKASIANNNSKFYFFYNDFSCDKDFVKKPTKADLKEACYMLYIYFLYNGEWREWTQSSRLKGHVWKDRSPFIPFSLEDLEEYAKATSQVQILIPAPPGGESVQILTYKKGAFAWEEGKTSVFWEVSSQKEMERFKKNIDGHRAKSE